MKTGGLYREAHVERLQKQLDRPLVCLADIPLSLSGVTVEPLRHNWDGWWSKLELFALEGPLVYLDLDVSIVGNPDRLYCDEFTMWDDPLFPGYFNSSVMSWVKPMKHVYNKFLHEGEALKKNYRRFPKGGDQGFISDHAGEIKSFEAGLIRSYRNDVKNNGTPEGTVIVAYHGRPKPWDIT